MEWRGLTTAPSSYRAHVDFQVRQLAEEIQLGNNWESEMALTVERHVNSLATHYGMDPVLVGEHFLDQFATRFGGHSPESYADDMAAELDQGMDM